mmetsp:Transcript_46644/g.107761  ORF Transcript_46644/g.107761 Transcript_46644/m.107761 type:complete len:329 (+) Transcript_46644:576-1562(+)
MSLPSIRTLLDDAPVGNLQANALWVVLRHIPAVRPVVPPSNTPRPPDQRMPDQHQHRAKGNNGGPELVFGEVSPLEEELQTTQDDGDIERRERREEEGTAGDVVRREHAALGPEVAQVQCRSRYDHERPRPQGARTVAVAQPSHTLTGGVPGVRSKDGTDRKDAVLTRAIVAAERPHSMHRKERPGKPRRWAKLSSGQKETARESASSHFGNSWTLFGVRVLGLVNEEGCCFLGRRLGVPLWQAGRFLLPPLPHVSPLPLPQLPWRPPNVSPPQDSCRRLFPHQSACQEMQQRAAWARREAFSEYLVGSRIQVHPAELNIALGVCGSN